MQRDYEFRGLEKPSQENINKPLPYSSGNTYLHELCFKGAPLPLIREAVSQLGADLRALNDKKMPPLGRAITTGNLAIIQCLLDLGAELYFPMEGGRHFSAVALAASCGQAEVLDLLLKNGGGIYINQLGTGAIEKEELPCLSTAVRDFSINTIEPLTAAGAFLDLEHGAEKLTPLQLAASLKDRHAFVEQLLLRGASIDYPQSSSGQTALHFAIVAGNDMAVECLLKYGANTEAVTAEDLTPLMLCARKGSTRIAELLLKASAQVNSKRSGADRETALHMAAAEGNSEMVELLLKKGADPLLTDVFNRTARNYAEKSISSYYIGYKNVISKLEESEVVAERSFFEKSPYQQPHRP